MAANLNPIFGLTPNTGRARLAAANTARDGSGTVATLVTAGANNTRVDKIVVTSAQATAAASSGMVAKLFISDTAGANYRMLQEQLLATVTASTTAIGATATFSFPGGELLLSGQLIGAIISVYAGAQDQMDFVVQQGWDY